MTFLHNETSWTIETLVQTWEKSWYVAGAIITGHFKPISLDDTTFDVWGMDGSLYKFTIQWDVTIWWADRIIIGTKTYIVKNVKKYKGLWFMTTKILLSYK